MSSIPLFTELDTKDRKDPLGPGYLNALAMNQLAIDNLAVVEHLDTGEHNAAEIPRTTERVRFSAGTYTLEGAVHPYATLAGGHNPAVGSLILTFPSDILDPDFCIVDATNLSESGSAGPVSTSAFVVDATHVELFSQAMTSGLGVAGNVWAAEDCNLSVSVHSLPLAVAYTSVTIPATMPRGGWLTQTAQHNLVEANSALRSRFLLNSTTALTAHTTAGAHDVREIAKGIGYVSCSGGTYTLDASAVGISSITKNGTGDVTVNFSSLYSPTQAFVQVVYPRSTGMSGPLTPYSVGCPRSTCTTTSVRLYFYGYDSVADTWARADCDFFVAIHGDF